MNNNELEVEILPEESNSSFLQFKIIVIGNSGVGKSNLLNATRKTIIEKYEPTTGFDFFTFSVKIDSKIIKLNIWDTCGQELYRSLIQNYYRNTSLAIIVYAIDNIQSFEEVDSWVREIKQYSSPDIKIFLIGNKSDLKDKRVVTYDMGQDIAKELNFDYFIETSVKNGSNNEELIIQATRLLYLEYKKLISKQNLNLLSDSIMVKLYKNQNILLKEENSTQKKCCHS